MGDSGDTAAPAAAAELFGRQKCRADGKSCRKCGSYGADRGSLAEAAGPCSAWLCLSLQAALTEPQVSAPSAHPRCAGAGLCAERRPSAVAAASCHTNRHPFRRSPRLSLQGENLRSWGKAVGLQHLLRGKMTRVTRDTPAGPPAGTPRGCCRAGVRSEGGNEVLRGLKQPPGYGQGWCN